MELALIVAVALIAIGFVAYPLVSSREKNVQLFSEQALDDQVMQYRAALKRGTLCEHCLSANAPGSKYCSECGRSLT